MPILQKPAWVFIKLMDFFHSETKVEKPISFFIFLVTLSILNSGSSHCACVSSLRKVHHSDSVGDGYKGSGRILHLNTCLACYAQRLNCRDEFCMNQAIPNLPLFPHLHGVVSNQ